MIGQTIDLTGQVDDNVGAERHLHADLIRTAEAVDDPFCLPLLISRRIRIRRAQMLFGKIRSHEVRPLFLHELEQLVGEVEAVLDRFRSSG